MEQRGPPSDRGKKRGKERCKSGAPQRGNRGPIRGPVSPFLRDMPGGPVFSPAVPFRSVRWVAPFFPFFPPIGLLWKDSPRLAARLAGDWPE
jgi:hypothetical protein